MKIDCPHCGVQGSVDDSLAGKKLRCPKCSKVFLVTDDMRPDMDDRSLAGQDIVNDSEPEEKVVQNSTKDEDDFLSLMGDEDFNDGDPVEESTLGVCSACSQTFASEFLVEVDSRLYCALCQPDDSDDEEGLILVSDDEELVVVDEDDDFLAFTGDDDYEPSLDSTVLKVCAGCGESFNPEFLDTVEGKQYCGLCLPEDDEESLELVGVDEEIELDETLLEIGTEEKGQPEAVQALVAGATAVAVAESDKKDVVERVEDTEEVDDAVETNNADFTVGELLKEAWQKTKGAKAAIWGGSVIVYLILFGIGYWAVYASQGMYEQGSSLMANGINGGLQLFSSWLSMLFTGGLMFIGVRRALGQRVSWKMVFAGFSGSKILSMTIAVILQVVLIMIGFILLVLPGIYLSVGYALALPLILDKGLGPWEALETSRKAIHKKWWTVLGMYIVMGLLYIVSAIPLGLGLIWTIPMFFVLIGVLYVRFFGSSEDFEEDEEIEEGSEESL